MYLYIVFFIEYFLMKFILFVEIEEKWFILICIFGYQYIYVYRQKCMCIYIQRDDKLQKYDIQKDNKVDRWMID